MIPEKLADMCTVLVAVSALTYRAAQLVDRDGDDDLTLMAASCTYLAADFRMSATTEPVQILGG